MWAGSEVGIATGYGLDGPGIEGCVGRQGSGYSDWLWTRRSGDIMQLGLWAHPASCTMRIFSFPGVNSGRGVTLKHYKIFVPWS